jgi:rod shape-determining protein MreD
VRAVSGMLLLAGAALLIRSTAFSVLAARGVTVDVLAFVTVVWALRCGESWGSTFGFVLGLAADLDAAHWPGRHALVLALAGYGTGRLSRALVRDNAATQLLLLFVVTVAHQAWSLAFEVGGIAGWRLLLTRVLVSGLVTAPLGVLLLALVRLGSGRPLFRRAPADTTPRP